MYRPPPRSRSPSPGYRQRRYSPSRPRSPSPPRRYDSRDDSRPARYENYPPRRYSPSPPRRRYSPSPPRQMGREGYYGRSEDVPPPRRYDDYPIRRNSPSRYDRQYEDEKRSSIPPPRSRDWDRVEPEERGKGMMADRGYEHPKSSGAHGGQWERGQQIEEEVSSSLAGPVSNAHKSLITLDTKRPLEPLRVVNNLRNRPKTSFSSISIQN